MPKTTYSKTEEMINNLCSNGMYELSTLEMTAVIVKIIGSDPRTIKNAIKTMLTTGLIKVSDKGFKLCPTKNTREEEEKNTQFVKD